MKRITLFVLMMITRYLSADSVDEWLLRVESAVNENRHSLAINLLEQGKAQWPKEPRIRIRAGDLYQSRELYRLALAEYKNAESLDPDDPGIVYSIGKSYGYLGKNNEAVQAFETVVRTAVDLNLRNSAVDSLGWMYFKTQQMADGIALLEEALDDRFDRNWAHTLGTLYSGIYNFEKSKMWYMRAIEDALNFGEEEFASIAYYNLSILESAFYDYDGARIHAERSLALRKRAGGYLIEGELDFLAWNLTDALDSYREAENLDVTPLARVNIAHFYQRIGRLDASIRFVQTIKEESDNAWMYHFGVDTDRFSMELNKILAAAWTGKGYLESMKPQWGGGHRLFRNLRSWIWRLRGKILRMHFQAMALEYAEELMDEGNILDAEMNAYRGTQGYRYAALRHLESARALEVSLTHRAIPWYHLEFGLEKQDPGALQVALAGFQSQEVGPQEQALRGIAASGRRRGGTEISRAAAAQLYALNPGGLRQYGLSLPIHLILVGEGHPRVWSRIKSVLNSAGYTVLSTPGIHVSTLTVQRSESGYQWSMSDPEGRSIARIQSETLQRRRDIASVLARLLDRFYWTSLE